MPGVRRLLAPALVVAMSAGGSAAAGAVSAAGGSGLAVHGTMAGTYRPTRSNPDTGRTYSVEARGRTNLGATKAAGSVRGPGNLRRGRCTASIVFRTSKGNIRAAIQSTRTYRSFAACQSGFAFSWHSVTATGRYAGRSASGTGTLTLVRPGNASTDPPPAYITLDR